MRQSHVIDIGGTFSGAAIGTARGFRFHPIHPELLDLAERSWNSLEELRHAARRRLSAIPPPATPDQLRSAFGALLLASSARHPD